MGSDEEKKISLSPNWNLQTHALCNSPRSWKSSVSADTVVMVCSADSSAWLQGLCYPYVSQPLCFRRLDCISSRRVCPIAHSTERFENEFGFSNKPLWLLQKWVSPDWLGQRNSPG